MFVYAFYCFSSCSCYGLQIYTIFFKQTNIFVDLLIIFAINQEIYNKMQVYTENMLQMITNRGPSPKLKPLPRAAQARLEGVSK